jgi:hypothetical protein
MSVSFFASRSLWLFDRLISMVRSASGSVPIIYIKPTGQVILLAAKGSAVQTPTNFTTYRQVQRNPPDTPEALG